MENEKLYSKSFDREIVINNKSYTYGFYGDTHLRPSLISYSISETNISEYDKYEKDKIAYGNKSEDLLTYFTWIIIVIIYTVGVIYIGRNNNIEDNWWEYILFIILPIIGFPIFFPMLMIPGAIIYGLLDLLIPNKIIANIVIKIFGYGPIKPPKWGNVDDYKKACEQFRRTEWDYIYKFPGIKEVDYDLIEFGVICIKSAVEDLKSFTNFQNGLIYKDNLRQDQKYWFDLDPYEFEKEVAYWFEQQGYNSKVTKKSGDGGVDIIISKNEYTAYVQCKRFKASKVDRPTLNALYGVVCADNANQGIVVSLLGVTNEARDFAEKTGIKIITIDDLAPENNLFHHRTQKQTLFAEPVQINKSWLQIGNLCLKTCCYRTPEDALNQIAKCNNKELYRPMPYKGIYLCIYGNEEDYKKFIERGYKKIEPNTISRKKYRKKTYKRRYWRY